jgi:hypothetical protein
VRGIVRPIFCLFGTDSKHTTSPLDWPSLGKGGQLAASFKNSRNLQYDPVLLCVAFRGCASDQLTMRRRSAKHVSPRAGSFVAVALLHVATLGKEAFSIDANSTQLLLWFRVISAASEISGVGPAAKVAPGAGPEHCPASLG